MKQLASAVLISLLTLSCAVAAPPEVQELPPEALIPPGSGLRVVNGMVSTAEFLDYLIKDMKTKLLAEKDVMDCYKLTPKNVSVYDAAGKVCKKDSLKVTPPKLRPPRELERVAGRFGSCMQSTMLEKQKITQQQFYECGQSKQKK